MKTVVMATTNPNKIETAQRLLIGTAKVLSISDVTNDKIPEPEESADNSEGIAIEKAAHYAKHLPAGNIVISRDDCIIFDGVSPEDNPGLHLKQPVIEHFGDFSDEHCAAYYTELARKYGGEIPVRFHYGIAIAQKIQLGGRESIKCLATYADLEAKLVDEIHNLDSVPWFFLAAVCKVKIGDEWIFYNELTDEQKNKQNKDIAKAMKLLLEQF